MVELHKRRFDVEHALLLHAHSYVVLPAAAIYEEQLLKEFENTCKKCHIYVIGHTARVFLKDVQQVEQTATLIFEIDGRILSVQSTLPEGATLRKTGDAFRIVSESGEEYQLTDWEIAKAIKRQKQMLFNVLYIGQAYGKTGERAALDRLKKHETLQKIALQGGVPEGSTLTILLLEIVPANRMMTVFNPRAIDQSCGVKRIQAGLDKLFGTSERERVVLYEASLIRYFQPHYNKEFKDSFPSTNMKVLEDCYDKDFSGVVAEINFDDLPWDLASEKVPAAWSHIAKHSLHTAEERQIFFSR